MGKGLGAAYARKWREGNIERVHALREVLGGEIPPAIAGSEAGVVGG